MARTIFKYLREEKTYRTPIIMQERKKGQRVHENDYLTQTELARGLEISQQTLDRAENGKPISVKTLLAYHRYFDVPYETLLGESTALDSENVDISMALGLTDETINSIRRITRDEVSRAMLNLFFSNEANTVLFFNSIANYTHTLSLNSQYKNDEYIRMMITNTLINFLTSFDKTQSRELIELIDKYENIKSEMQNDSEELAKDAEGFQKMREDEYKEEQDK